MKLRSFTVTTLALFTLAYCSGCQFDNSRLERLDPDYTISGIPYYNSLEKTSICLAKDTPLSSQEFNKQFSAEWKKLTQKDIPPNEDWSKLVCLSFYGQASLVQVRKAVKVVDSIIATQEDRATYKLKAMQVLLKRKANTMAQLATARRKAKALQHQHTKVQGDYAQLILDKNQQISELEVQVRKLREIEILIEKN